MNELLTSPVFRLFGVVYLVLVLKMVVVGAYTSVLRITGKIYATPEDYKLQGLAPRSTVNEDIERVRRAHRNDLENILPFFGVGLLYALTNPSLAVARVLLIGYAAARVLHSVFYIMAWQPHRTIAFGVALTLMLAMLFSAIVTFA
jgi:glutathione S-transferase